MDKEMNKVVSELEKYGLDNDVSVIIQMMENDRGRRVPHMVAKWNETMMSPNGYDEMPTSRCEEMNRFFSPKVFAIGITQRAKWIKADQSDCVEYLEENPFGHPALFPVWMEAQNIIA